MYRWLEDGYELLEGSSDETPARFVDLKVWPRRESIRRPVIYNEWIDWAELFAEGGDEKLAKIAQAFSSESICVSGISFDTPYQLLPTVRVVRIAPEKLTDVFFVAIWNEQSIWPDGALSAVARTTMVWDQSEKWILLNDRYYEIGLFAVLEGPFTVREGIFEGLDQQALLERFSRLLAAGRIAAHSELAKWAH